MRRFFVTHPSWEAGFAMGAAVAAMRAREKATPALERPDPATYSADGGSPQSDPLPTPPDPAKARHVALNGLPDGVPDKPQPTPDHEDSE